MAQRGELSRERVLSAAREAAEEDGIGALSMRRLAQRLDVWPMSIYTYFRDKGELLDALAEEAAEAVEARPGSRSWRSDMHLLLDGARRAVAADPSPRLPRVMLARTSARGVGILERGGYSPSEAASIWRTLIGYAFGFAATATDEPAVDEDEFARGVDRILAGAAAAPRPRHHSG